MDFHLQIWQPTKTRKISFYPPHPFGWVLDSPGATGSLPVDLTGGSRIGVPRVTSLPFEFCIPLAQLHGGHFGHTGSTCVPAAPMTAGPVRAGEEECTWLDSSRVSTLPEGTESVGGGLAITCTVGGPGHHLHDASLGALPPPVVCRILWNQHNNKSVYQN